MAASNLTILLPLKGRPLHTLRFLWDANRRKLPYRFLIADGEVHPTIAELLESPSKAFPDLDIEYVRYPDDISFSHFYRKMADASARVGTKYVMQADNDDFLIPSGIDRCLEFLDANPDYASYGAGIGAFALTPRVEATLNLVTGPLDRLAFRYGPAYWPKDMSSPEALARCTAGFTSVLYYNVFRAQSLATIHRELVERDFTDLEIFEAYFTLRALTLGKSGQDPRVMSYMRQLGTSSAGAWQGDDWVGHLLKSRFNDDFNAFLRRVGAAIAEADGIDAESAANKIRDLYAKKLRADLSARYPGPLPERPRYDPVRIVKAMMSAAGLLKLYYAERSRREIDPKRRAARVERERQSVVESLKQIGASAADIKAFSTGFAGVEKGFRSEAFEKFVAGVAPDLLVS